MVRKYENRIEIKPKVMVGKPVIKGTRITVELILRQLAQGINIKDILRNYPHLNKKDIYAAIKYGADLVEAERVYPPTQKAHAKAAYFRQGFRQIDFCKFQKACWGYLSAP